MKVKRDETGKAIGFMDAQMNNKDAMRERFEKYCNDHELNTERISDAYGSFGGLYWENATVLSWMAWQAAEEGAERETFNLTREAAAKAIEAMGWRYDSAPECFTEIIRAMKQEDIAK